MNLSLTPFQSIKLVLSYKKESKSNLSFRIKFYFGDVLCYLMPLVFYFISLFDDNVFRLDIKVTKKLVKLSKLLKLF